MKKINVFSEFVVFFMIFNVFMLGNRFYRRSPLHADFSGIGVIGGAAE